MSTNTNTSLLEKIRHLFKMADPKNGATQNEMEVALRKAQELMTRHGLENISLEGDSARESIDKERVETGRRKRDEDRWIPAVLKKVFGVEILFSKVWDSSVGARGDYRHIYVIVGEVIDREAAKMALPLIFEAMKTGLNAHLKMRGIKWNTHTANSFYHGVADGFIKESTHGRAAAMRSFKQEEQDRFAIVLVDKEKAIKRFMDEKMDITKGRRSSSRAGIDPAAREHGFRVGASLDFTTKIG